MAWNGATRRTILDVFITDIENRVAQMDKIVMQGISNGLDLVLENSQEKCPVDKGDLLASGRKELHPDTLSGEVIYGDENAPYALYVHEKLDESINWTKPGTGPKFLEIAAEEENNNVAKAMNAAINLV